MSGLKKWNVRYVTPYWHEGWKNWLNLAGEEIEDEQNGSDDGGDEDDDEDQHERQTNHEGDDDDDDNDFDEDSYHRQVKKLQKKAISRFAELKQQSRARTNTKWKNKWNVLLKMPPDDQSILHYGKEFSPSQNGFSKSHSK